MILHSTADQATGLRFAVNVTNVGARRGSKVVAAFVSYACEGITGGPRKQLFAMQRVMLPTGASQLVTLESAALAGFCAFCSFDEAGVAEVRPGLFTVTVGNGGDGNASVLLSTTLSVAAAP